VTWPQESQVAAGIYSNGQSQSALAILEAFLPRIAKRTPSFPSPRRKTLRRVGSKRTPLTSAAFDPQKLAARACEKAHLAVKGASFRLDITRSSRTRGGARSRRFSFLRFAATALEDKRSCLNERMGKQLFGQNISISDDVYHPLQQVPPSMARECRVSGYWLVDRGVPKNLVYSRAAAKAAHKQPTGTVLRFRMNTGKRR